MGSAASVEMSGPFFDGGLAGGIAKATKDIQEELARIGKEAVLGRLSQVLRNPTGYYESQITTEAAGGGMTVTDQNVVYGPWLSGSGSRNASSSFKGYDHWDVALAAVEARIQAVGEAKIAEVPK